ncbi:MULTISPECIES: endonuclease/exonuclease/phosphatase family protein [Methylorubrum]|uniref:endonuclease/exonuclease/phosphatase family protein n=1 Tax=Methylorubrum TaxID=2282523 RepID=UPI00209E7969|nr:endonuclease/exonuclease/phosphatase family metal-dependent hydrolase [Methylorubrum zatmanii]MCP1553221.1 endonuclease/exonuclease/phosphatase family metal-dependent hydrolase [Methylorubrum extorquens]MCP1580467.1 endonuclease/exonuclease/phosphatase family metal-dependent hydrolase [Methylorubrum extorquens]
MQQGQIEAHAEDRSEIAADEPASVASRRLRLLTYNVRHCRGTDGRVAPERVARVIAACAPDIVALQEVDVGRKRTGGLDQAEEIARLVGMFAHFHPALHIEEERYGDALLTHLPSRLRRAGPLPGLLRRPGLEPRGALWIEVTAGAGRLQVLTTHFGLLGAERVAQAEALLGPDWLGGPACDAPAVLLGDFNATGWSRAYRRLSGRLTDARRLTGERRWRRGGATFPSRFPLLRIDHVFVSERVTVERVAVVDTPLARKASDHRPLLAEIRIEPG